jgi:hypothetical protein
VSEEIENPEVAEEAAVVEAAEARFYVRLVGLHHSHSLPAQLEHFQQSAFVRPAQADSSLGR